MKFLGTSFYGIGDITNHFWAAFSNWVTSLSADDTSRLNFPQCSRYDQIPFRDDLIPCNPYQCWAVLRMRERSSLVINPGVYPVTHWFSIFSKKQF
jgi:hypothetical protein